MAVPARIAWAVELLNVQPGDYILEIGCGRGVAAKLVCDQLQGGQFTGIDRSEKAIAAAAALNADHLATGRARFIHSALERPELGSGRFPKILAINVNAFWTEGPEASAHARALLADDGRLLLVYEPPTLEGVKKLRDPVAEGLEAAGLRLAGIKTETRGGHALICFVAEHAS